MDDAERKYLEEELGKLPEQARKLLAEERERLRKNAAGRAVLAIVMRNMSHNIGKMWQK